MISALSINEIRLTFPNHEINEKHVEILRSNKVLHKVQHCELKIKTIGLTAIKSAIAKQLRNILWAGQVADFKQEDNPPSQHSSSDSKCNELRDHAIGSVELMLISDSSWSDVKVYRLNPVRLFCK